MVDPKWLFFGMDAELAELLSMEAMTVAIVIVDGGKRESQLDAQYHTRYSCVMYASDQRVVTQSEQKDKAGGGRIQVVARCTERQPAVFTMSSNEVR